MKMIMCTIMAVLEATCYGVRTYSRMPDPPLYRSLEDMPGRGLGRLFAYLERP